MMKQMRENTKVILWIVVVAFIVTIFAVWGLDLQTGSTASSPNVIGKVNGVKITRQQYQNVYQRFVQQYRASTQNQQLTYSQEEFIRTQAWDNVVYNVLTSQEIRRLGITVSDEEIVFFLRNTPPPEVRQFFLTPEGQFDVQGYEQALNDPEVDWTALEALARERIPLQKLNDYLGAQIHVTESEIQRAYELEAVELTISYARFPLDDVDLKGYTPSESEIQTFYEENKDDFVEPDRVRVELLQLEIKPNAADMDDARFTASDVYDQLEDGDEFADLAKTYSDAPSSFVGGSAGYIRRGLRDDAYFDALDAVENGQLTKPVATEEGFYVLKRVETQETPDGVMEYNALEILIKPTLSRQTSDSLFTVAADIREQALNLGLEEAGAAHNLIVVKPDPISVNGPIGEIGFVPSINRFAFNETATGISAELRDDNTIYLVRVVERLPESALPIDDVRGEIRDIIYLDKQNVLALQKARAFFLKAKSSDLETALETYNLPEITTEPFRGSDNLEPFGSYSPIAEAALTVMPGEFAPPVESGDAYVVLKVEERGELDTEDYKARIPAIRDQIRNQKIQAYVTYWYDRLKEKSVIEDYRLSS
ncbi:MAG: SurA N-terminal domain-containing protein [bacterium]|nr:SurA N-terminal domain-containing protein [bacterium]